MEANSLITSKTCPDCNKKYGPEMERCPDDASILMVVRRDPFVGMVLADRYEILTPIGVGGYAAVYLAHQKTLKRKVAVKILHGEFAQNAEKLKRFQLEAELISSIVHNNLTAVFDFGVLPLGQPYLVMEYLDGKTLLDIISQDGPLYGVRAVDFFVQACSGLATAHAVGLIHRDLKPENILVVKAEDGSERVKIVDFGAAKVLLSNLVDQELTKTGHVVGTPAYMSPEQCKGQVMDVRSDIYSLGCVMYCVLAKQQPIKGANTFDTMKNHCDVVPIPLSQHIPGIPKGLEDIVARTLEKDPAKRHANMDELKEALLSLDKQELKSKAWEDSLYTQHGVAPKPTAHTKEVKVTKGTKSPPSKRSIAIFAAIAMVIAFLGMNATSLLVNQMEDEDQVSVPHGSFVEYSNPPVKFQYPSSFIEAWENPKQNIVQHFELKGHPECYIDLKLYPDNQVTNDMLARAQEEYHEGYPGYTTVVPIGPLMMGKNADIEGCYTTFTWMEKRKKVYERHTYFGRGANRWKFKQKCPFNMSQDTEQIAQSILDTLEFK